MKKLTVTLRIDFDADHAIGPGKIALLEKMRACGSLSQAARELGMSYRRAWELLNDLNHCFDQPLVLTAVGGSGGGGSSLTPLGEALVAAYRTLESDTNERAAKQFASFARRTQMGSHSAHKTRVKRPARSAARTRR